MGIPWREVACASACEISLQVERGTEKFVLFFKGARFATCDFADLRESVVGPVWITPESERSAMDNLKVDRAKIAQG